MLEDKAEEYYASYTRLNWSLILHVYNEEKYEVDLTAVANQFILGNFCSSTLYSMVSN